LTSSEVALGTGAAGAVRAVPTLTVDDGGEVWTSEVWALSFTTNSKL
jgi:hypothetical protein